MVAKASFLREIKGGLKAELSTIDNSEQRRWNKLSTERIPAGEDLEERTFTKLSTERMQELVIEHREHGKRLAWSFLTSWRVNLRNDEIHSIVGAALCEAANRFDETREASFKTFFFYYLRGMLLKEIAKMINDQRIFHYIPNLSIDIIEDYENAKIPISQIEQDDPEKLILKKQSAEECWGACQILDELEREVIFRHFIDDESLIKIAKELKYCRCHISRVKSRGLAKLKRYFKKKKNLKTGIADRLVPTVIRVKKKADQSYTGGRGRRKVETLTKKVQQIRNLKLKNA